VHVLDVELSKVDDLAIWAYAAQRGYTIISKDADFADLVLLARTEVRVIWVRIGNCRKSARLETFKKSMKTIEDELSAGETLIELNCIETGSGSVAPPGQLDRLVDVPTIPYPVSGRDPAATPSASACGIPRRFAGDLHGISFVKRDGTSSTVLASMTLCGAFLTRPGSGLRMSGLASNSKRPNR
jgi:predicted nuclease of predicted toxin-antitoxin system